MVLRMSQGLGIGGEWSSAVLLAVEHPPRGRRGFFGSYAQVVPTGLLLGNVVLLPFASLLPEEQFFLGMEAHDPMYGPQAAYFSELFGTRVRYSGASLGYQLASVFAGGLAPLIATALLAASGYTAVAIYMAIMALITVVSVILASETYQEDILETQEGERRLVAEGPGEPGTT